MKTTRRSFLKFLSVSPAIFQALPVLAESKFKKKIPKDTKGTQKHSNEPLSNPSRLNGTIKYNPYTQQIEVWKGNRWEIFTSMEKYQNA